MTRRKILTGLVFLTLFTHGATAAEPKRVLILDSLGREFAPFSVFASQFRTALAQQSPGPVEFFDVPVIISRPDQAIGEEPLIAYLQTVFAGRPPDLLVPIGAPAVRFTQRNRQRLFPMTPVLLASVDQRNVQSTALTTNDAVAAMKLELPKTIENILHVLPATTNVVVVIGNSPIEKFWVAEVRREFAAFTNRVGFVWFNELSYDEMRQRAAVLPPHSAIFYGVLCIDADGIPHEDEEALAGLHQVANAPLFGTFDFHFGRGIVGGQLMSMADLSRKTAAVAIRILGGESPSSFRLPAEESGKPVFDWRELRRWGIHESDLPPGSIVQFRQPKFFEVYRWWIAGAVAVCLFEAALIIGLLLHRAKHLQGEAEASLIADISTKFVNLSVNEVDREIMDALRRICEFLDLDMSALRQWSDEAPDVFALIYYYSAQEGPLPPKKVKQETFPWIAQQILAGRVVSFASLDELPAEASRDREAARQMGIQSSLCLPLSVGGKPVGILSLNAMRAKRDWPSALVNRLQMLAHIFANALARKQADQELRERETRLRDLNRRLLRAHEEERARLARELHDDFTQRLAVLAIDTGRLEGVVADAPVGATMRKVREGLVRLSEDVHALSYRLHPSVLDDLGLAEALKTETEHFFRREGIPVNIKLRDVPEPLPRDVALCLFRVTQEALRNVGRHAKAGTVEVSLWPSDGGLQLSVRDNGAGFDLALHRQQPSLGLASMRERVDLLAGELDIESAPGQGTNILVWLPLKAEPS